MRFDDSGIFESNKPEDQELVEIARKRQIDFMNGRLSYVGHGFFADFMARGRARRKYAHIEPPFKDHGRLFRDRQTKELLYVLQPYIPVYRDGREVNLDRVISESKEFARQYGLTVEVSMEKSWYWPGRTVLICYRKK